MANVFFTVGKQRIGELASGLDANTIRSMSVDDGTAAFAAGHTTLSSGATPTSVLAKDFDSLPTRSGTTIEHRMTLGTSDFNGNTIRRIVLHNQLAASVNASSATLICGIDQQSIAKTSSFSLTLIVQITYN